MIRRIIFGLLVIVLLALPVFSATSYLNTENMNLSIAGKLDIDIGTGNVNITTGSLSIGNGIISYNDSDNSFIYYNGSAWKDFGITSSLNSVPVGTIIPFGGTALPTGYLECNGQAVSRTTYANLYAVVGTTYGSGDGSTTFNLPDFRGRVALGNGTGTDDNTGSRSFGLGDEGGEFNHTLSVAEMPSHTHDIAGYDDTSIGFHSNVVRTNFAGMGTAITLSTGGDTPHNILQPYLAVRYIIKYGNSGTVSPGTWNYTGNNLYPSSTSYNVGIGTTDPKIPLQIFDLDPNISTSNHGIIISNKTVASARHGKTVYMWVNTANKSEVSSYDYDVMTWKDLSIAPSGGNVGIGTFTPRSKLVVEGESYTDLSDTDSGAGNSTLLIKQDTNAVGASALEFAFGNNAVYSGARIVGDIVNSGGADLLFQTAPSSYGNYTTKMIIKRDGTIGIGTTTPDAPLDIRKTVSDEHDYFFAGDGAGDVFRITRDDDLSSDVFIWLGANKHLWIDSSGKLRYKGSNPTSDTDGSVVGDQSSALDTKKLHNEFNDTQTALQTIVNTQVYNFTYRDGSYNNQSFVGIITDYSPVFGKDRDLEHPAGKALNEVTAIGYLVSAIKELESENQAKDTRIDALENYICSKDPQAEVCQ